MGENKYKTGPPAVVTCILKFEDGAEVSASVEELSAWDGPPKIFYEGEVGRLQVKYETATAEDLMFLFKLIAASTGAQLMVCRSEEGCTPEVFTSQKILRSRCGRQ